MAFRMVIRACVMLVAWMIYAQNSFSQAQVFDPSESDKSVLGSDPEYISYSTELDTDSWSSSYTMYTTYNYTWEDLTCQTESCRLPQRFRICRCDPLCDFFWDCCRDFNATDSLNSALNLFKDTDLWECVDFGEMCADLLPDVNGECLQLISNCPRSWSDETVRRSCQQKDGTAPVVLDDRGLHFINEYCALCNGANIETLRPYLEFMDHPCPTYDFKCAYFPASDTVGNESSSDSWVPDPHFCFPDMVQSCPLNPSVSDITRRQCEADFAPIVLGDLFRNSECAQCHGYIPNQFFECPGTNTYHGSYVTCVGEPLYFSFFDYTEKQQLVAKVFFGISCAALILTFLTYCVFSTLRNMQGILVMQFIVALFMAQVLLQFVTPSLKAKSFYASVYISQQGTDVCVAVACASHFFSLSAFSLMSVMAWDLSRSLTFSKTVTRRDSISRKRLLSYSICGWGFPVLVVGPCLGVHALSVKNRSFELFYYGDSDCWLHPSMRTIQAFLVPVSICLFFNFMLFVRVICQLRAIKKECRVLKTGQSSEQQRKDTVAALRLYIKISCLFGFGWLFGYLGAFVKVSELWYVFIVLNSLQGVLFFFSFGMNARTRKLWRASSTKRLGQFSSSFATSSTRFGTTTVNSTSRSMPRSNKSTTKV